MSIIATALKHMLASGMTPDAIVAAVADMEANTPKDAAADRRRQADKERKRLRKSAESAETADDTETDSPPSPKEIPQTPLEITPYPKPLSPPKGGSFPAGFELFWELYPNKVGKPVAAKKFAAALKAASFETIMAGLAAYVAKTDDRPWCNPATWLHQQRWADEPSQVARGSPSRAPNLKDALDFLSQAERANHDDSRSSESPLRLISGTAR